MMGPYSLEAQLCEENEYHDLLTTGTPSIAKLARIRIDNENDII